VYIADSIRRDASAWILLAIIATGVLVTSLV
jgi:hypothetical protein